MKLLTMYIDEDEDGQTLTIDWEDDSDIVTRLGVLSWAMAIETEAVKIRNTLDRYAIDEEDE